MRGFLAVVGLIALASCDDTQTDGGNPGLFEPWLFNDVAYNVSFVGSNPIADPALLAQGFIAGRDIAVFRMTDVPFDAGDAAEAEAVAADFCAGATRLFVSGAEGLLFDRGGFVFPQSCLERQG